MNIPNMLNLIKFLEREDVRDLPREAWRDNRPGAYLEEHPGNYFQMPSWRIESNCGTAACVAGWACALFAPNLDRFREPISLKGQEVLGINEYQAYELFHRVNWSDLIKEIAKEKGEKVAAITLLKEMVCDDLKERRKGLEQLA